MTVLCYTYPHKAISPDHRDDLLMKSSCFFVEIHQPSSDGGGGGTPALPFKSVQFNDSGSFGGSSGFIYDSGSVNIGSLATSLTKLNLDGGNNYGVVTFSDYANTTSQGGMGIEGADDSIIIGATKGDLSIYGGTGHINFSADYGSTLNMSISDTGVVTVANLGGGGTQMVVASNTGVLGVQTIPGGTNYWALTGVDIYNNNPGGVGIGQTTPLAELHVTPFATPSSFSASISLAASGYSFGSGSKNYTVYAENSTVPIFSTGVSTSFSEPSSGIYDPSGGSASFSGPGGGYTASGYDFSYTVWALYVGQTAISIGNTATNDTGTDPNDGSTYNVNVSWNAPSGGTPDAYLVLSGGSNPNGGQYQVVSGTSFTDTDSGWSGSASYSPLQYQVSLSYSPAGPSTDSYTLTNNTTTTFLIPGNTTSATDDATWTSGTPTVTPTGQSKTAIFDGPQVDFNTVSYNFPNSQTAGFFNNDGAGNLSWRGISGGDITGFSDKQILFGSSGGSISQSSGFFIDTSSGSDVKLAVGTGGNNATTLSVNGDFQYGVLIADNSGSGVQNDFNVNGGSVLRFGNTSTTYTGFTVRTSMQVKVLYIINGGTTVTLANENTGSSAANRIMTGSGSDLVMAPNTVATLLYSANATRWVVQNLSSLFQNTTGILASTTGINAKTVANTNLYTVPAGRTAIVTGFITRVSAASAITVGPTAGLGNTGGTNNIAPSQTMTALLTTADTYVYNLTGAAKTVTAGNSVFFNLSVASTGTSQTLIVEPVGYLI